MGIDSGKPGYRRVARALISFIAGIAAILLVSALANAAQTHVLLGTFCEPTGVGAPPCAPTLSAAVSAAVEQSSGDLLVVEAGAQRISRYHADGTPSNFSALGANVIDGAGPGADATPQNSLSFDPGFGDLYGQIAVDNSGTATDGNIYVTQNGGAGSVHLVDVFASSGEYLGQITGAGSGLGAVTFGSGPEAEGILSPCGVAVDPAGNVYVAGWREDKIYKFDPSASPPTPTDHVATFSVPQPCQLAAGAGPSAGALFVSEYIGKASKLRSSDGALECEVKGGLNSQLSVNPADGHLFVVSDEPIAEYDASDCPPSLISSLDGERMVAVEEEEGKIYTREDSAQLVVYSGLVPLPDATTGSVSSIEKTSATLNGTVEAFGEELTECFFEYGVTTSYGQTAPCEESFAEIGVGTTSVHADISGLSEETAYHYRLVAGNANGRGKPGQDEPFRTKSKPELLGAWAQDVALKEATLKASINPQSGADATYRFEWGVKAPPEAEPTYEHSTADIAIDSKPNPHTVGFFLAGLVPGTTYHFRVVAENEMGATEGGEHTFTTYLPPESDSCKNDTFRTGASVFLPDCRAHEMVSPVDKNGGDIISEMNGAREPGGRIQASLDGNAITYTAIAAFADTPSNFRFNQYMANRHEVGASEEGWSNQGIRPPVSGHKIKDDSVIFGFTREFIAFSPDLCSAWLADYQDPPLTPEGQKGVRNLYRRDNCGEDAGQFEALVPSPAYNLSGTSPEYVSYGSVQGNSDDSRHAIFSASAKLTEEAAAGNNDQLYDRFCPTAASHICHSGEGRLALVSVLPDKSFGDAAPGDGQGFAATDASKVGSGPKFNFENAVSTNGSEVYWTGSGIYVRLHPEQGIVAGEYDESGKCSNPATVACTLPVSGPSGFFWTAAADGSKALYTQGDELHLFDLGAAENGEAQPAPIAENVTGVAGASEDLARIYFVSTDILPGAGKNSEGEEAAAGQPNLYLSENGTFSFIGTLVAGDVGALEPGTVRSAYDIDSEQPYERATRVSPDGAHLAFNSRAPLTSYDNASAEDGRAAVEVYLYQAGGGLRCVSCNPSGARPSGVQQLGEAYTPEYETRPTKVPAAAWIPTWESPLHASNVLSADGNRLFFNSFDALLPRDGNGAEDVYEWEAAGAGGCDEGDADYFPSNGGCLYLISSGESSYKSFFWEASPDGRDVFFTTESSLVPKDPGSVDLYDARVEGGFPEPPPQTSCEGETCQSPPPPPEFPTPSSFSHNVPAGGPGKSRCPKGKRRVGKGAKAHCVKKKRRHSRRRAAGQKRRTGR